nr:hypothetical protein [Tanacetum cinerariifolium]
MSTNVKLPTCDIKTDHVIPNEAADVSSEVEISSNMPDTKNVVKKKQDKPDKGSESNSELFLDQLGLDLTGTIIVMLGRMWDVSAVTGRYLSTGFVMSDAKNDAYMLEFDRSTTIRKALVKAAGFVRYPFQLQDFDGIESSYNKYLIDVAGYVTNVGRTNHLKSGSRNLDFHLANHRVTLWGGLGDVLIEKKPNRLVCAQLLKYNNKVYLSSTSSTVIYDDDAIPAIKALKKANSVVNHQTSETSVDLSQPQAGTLENLLMWARNRKNDDKEGMELPFMWERHLYRFEVDVSDNTAQAVAVMFNETATALVNCSADSLMDTVDEILPSKGIDDSVGSSNLDDYADNQPQKMKSLHPNLMDAKDSETEDSSDSANAKGKKGVVKPSAKKRKKGLLSLMLRKGKIESCVMRPTKHRGPKIIKLGAAAAG